MEITKEDVKDLLELTYIIKQQCTKINNKNVIEEIEGCADAIIEIIQQVQDGPAFTVKRMI